MGGIIEKLKNWWLESNPTQRYTTLGGIGLTIILLVGVYSVASRPRYAMLYSGLSAADQGSIVSELQGQGIPVKYDVPGQVEVPADKVSELTMKLASSGKVPKSAHLGDTNLGDMNLYTTPAVERERLKAIAEGKLASAIETNPGVRTAGVHITLGDPSPFVEQQRAPTAAVNLVTTGNGSVSRDSAKGIAMLVANSVDGLDMKHVVVVDERTQPLYNGNELDGGDAAATNKLDMEQRIARKEEQRLQGILDGIYGAGSTKVSVNCEVDMDEKHVKKSERRFTKGAPTKSMKENMTGAASGPSGGSGIDSNLRAPSSDQTKPGDNYTSTVESLEPNSTFTETDSTPAVGTVKSMTINVAADSKETRFGDPAKLQELKTFVQNEVATKNKQNFVASVTPMAFDDTIKTQVTQAQGEAASSARLQQVLSVLPIAALLIVGIMVVKQIGKLGKPTYASVTTADGQVLQVPMVNGHVSTSYAMANHQDHHEPSHSDHLSNSLSRYTEEELAQMTEDGIIYRDNGEIVEVEKIREKKSVHLSAIKQMAKDRPEPTAMLIKTWLAETSSR